jgi:ApbE superfamily uncharacterized protein (UPF0280 family)
LPVELFEQGFALKESRIHLKSDKKEAINEAVKDIKKHRQNLEDYITKHPEFRYTLKPVDVLLDAPEIVHSMAEAATKAGVGPMAAVAGVLADLGMKAMLQARAKVAIVEDGGEVAVTTNQPVTVAILSSFPELSGKIGLSITEADSPLGVATSSSKTGRVISFGEADSVTVVATDASLADAAATAVCNAVAGEDVGASIQRGLEAAKAIEGVRGVIIIREGQTGLWGKLPKMVDIK